MSIKQVYLSRIQNNEIWRTSSSGGAFWSLVKYVIEANNGVCYGARYTDDLRIVHGRAETLEEAQRFRGSKYVQSDMKELFGQVLCDLRLGRYVLFSGTPCQVRAIQNYVPEKLQDNLLLIDILCHGTPSPRVFDDYLKLQESVYKSKVVEVNFRGKKLRNSIQDMYIRFASGKEYKAFGTQDIFYKLFFHELISRDCCHKCKFANKNRQSDITISDYWGDLSKVPDIFESKSGISCVFINSEKGKDIWNNILAVDELIAIESSMEICDQPPMNHPMPKAEYREAFWDLYLQKGILSAYEQYFGSYRKDRILRIVKNTLNEMGALTIIRKVRG